MRDVGRVMSHPYGFVDRIAKLMPFEVGMTLDKALQQEEALLELYQQDEEVTMLIDMARSLEGLTRNVGKHAGGVVISPSDLTDFTPLYCETGGGGLVSQFDKDDVEAVGLVKFDFLGLRTLTIIDWAVRAINAAGAATNRSRSNAFRWTMPPTFKLLQAYQTTAVFQLESRGMKDLIRRLQPDSFEDIIALVALFRPGPLQSGMVDDFIDRKHGRSRVEYPHPALEAILKPTYGVILYQEQVMQIAQVLAGYTLGEADLLRRAMGKKKPEEMEKQRAVFTEGARRQPGRRGDRDLHFRPDGKICRLRFQQIAFGRLRAGVLPDRLAEGALSGRIHGRRAVGGHGQYRQDRDPDRRMPQHETRSASTGYQSLQLPVHQR